MSAATLVHNDAPNSTLFDGSGNRRSACDRCRSQKIRCERGSDPFQCRRCVKANVECVTGVALKSGRPLQLYGTQMSQPSLVQETYQESPANLNNQQPLPDFPTPPVTAFDTPFEANPNPSDGDIDMQLLVSPFGFNCFDDMWTNNLERHTTAANLIQPATDPRTSQNDDRPPPPSALNLRNECWKKLADLHVQVLGDLEIVKACTTADKCTTSTANHGSDQTHNFLVGRMLDHSAALLDILNYFEPAPTDTPPVSNDARSRITQASPKRPRCDVPTMFSLLSCYTCLVRVYRTIFSSIQDSMPVLMNSPKPVPQLFPGMNLGGFQLESRIDLQVQILIQVSEDMMAKIEAKLGVGDDPAIVKGCIFDRERASKMLRMMLEEEAWEQPQLNETRGHCEPLRNILANLKGLNQMEGRQR
ncbi:uncharacterized protein Z518_04638 [Rhinocladiella mackenziei CBS 650.93]|uniref:Zn(2)-C6 fungal-type domain-containing protein n=1 Tax=Rhinocladiella mackenziei CBS 650.93 TaxID=1442369 RepID=A0A0D2FWN9_9EURO|nr:uncharacterized protein Z518_04638 [Rhinocladiella mackenziei CBS 650.93]KIX06662.1 hypothetical protein Z518_04638 [Rhinocladiella mackenziei CBS 650.93]